MIVDERTIESDPLSLTLASLSWSGWNSGAAHLAAPWGVDVPAGHVSLYAIREGSCYVSSPIMAGPVLAHAGDLLLFPTGESHRILSAPNTVSRPLASMLSPHLPPPATNENGGESATRIVYGHFSTAGAQANPLHNSLSRFLHLKISEYESLARAEHLLELLEREQREVQPGWQAVANQLVQLIFHQALRGFVSRGLQSARPADAHAASLVTDPVIGLVVGLLHAQPDKPWTVASLARWVNMSRSAFSERFRDVVGKPPLHYLTELRMAKACDLLRGSDLGVKQIAAVVGYESPSSFTNAFKRWNGISPAAFRGAPDEDVDGGNGVDNPLDN